jgi:hypothetical protein
VLRRSSTCDASFLYFYDPNLKGTFYGDKYKFVKQNERKRKDYFFKKESTSNTGIIIMDEVTQQGDGG